MVELGVEALARRARRVIARRERRHSKCIIGLPLLEQSQVGGDGRFRAAGRKGRLRLANGDHGEDDAADEQHDGAAQEDDDGAR